jgi:hypothetical protein
MHVKSSHIGGSAPFKVLKTLNHRVKHGGLGHDMRVLDSQQQIGLYKINPYIARLSRSN